MLKLSLLSVLQNYLNNVLFTLTKYFLGHSKVTDSTLFRQILYCSLFIIESVCLSLPIVLARYIYVGILHNRSSSERKSNHHSIVCISISRYLMYFIYAYHPCIPSYIHYLPYPYPLPKYLYKLKLRLNNYPIWEINQLIQLLQ